MHLAAQLIQLSNRDFVRLVPTLSAIMAQISSIVFRSLSIRRDPGTWTNRASSASVTVFHCSIPLR